MTTQFFDIVRKFPEMRVVVLGEAMLDRYSTGRGKRLSVEAPVPIVDNCTTLNFAGAAANTALNLRALGCQVSFVSVVGDDADATALSDILSQHDVNMRHLQQTASRRTLSKHRIFAGDHMLARVDHGTTSLLERMIERSVMRSLDELLPQAELLVISDYAYGVITPSILEYLAKRLAESPCCLAADSRRLQELARLSPTVVKPNYSEAAQLLGIAETAGDRFKQIVPRSEDLLRLTSAKIAAVTLDEDGAVVLEGGQPPHRTTTKPMPHSQAAGAGDSYLAAFALALASGASTEAAADLAAAAAAVVVSKTYTATCSMDELLAAVGAQKNGGDLVHLSAQMNHYRRLGRRIVLTNGCFDILHRGHVTYLERAKTLGDILVVGVNSDGSIQKLKGPDRPINCLEDRLGVLAGLSCIDHLASFDETTPERLIEVIRPEVFVKGGDYTRETLPEAPLVEALGGRVVLLPYLCDHSTTNIVERIREQQLAHSDGRNGRYHHATADVGRRAKRSLR